jgi:N-acetylmuramoyl-L-alanine amidase
MHHKVFFILLLISIGVFNSFSESGNKLDVIVIDAGHGGKDPGSIGVNGIKEKDVNLSIALKLGELIQQTYPDMKVIYTRSTDEFVEVHDRTVIANNNKAKLFISIHANHKKEEESDKNGFEIYLLNKERTPEAVAITQKQNFHMDFERFNADSSDNFIFYSLAQAGFLKYSEYLSSFFEMNLLNDTEIASRGVLEAGYWVLLGASMPSVLVETGYLSDEKDANYLASSEGQISIAKALFEGFNMYKMLYESD